MVQSDNAFDEEKPLDPAALRLQRKMRRLVLISSLTMVFGLMSVFVAILYRINRIDDTETRPPEIREFAESVTIPKGTEIVSATVSGDKLTVHLRADGAHSVMIFDAGTGKPLGSIALESPL